MGNIRMGESNNPHASDTGTPDQIRADRACIGCGFNLYGQTVTKEDHYGLAITRCPECGTVAALQQYPLMSHWVNRFRAILAGLYIVMLLGTLALSTMAISGFAFAATDLASGNLANHIGIDFTQWEQDQAENANQNAAAAGAAQRFNGVQINGSFRWVSISPVWVDEHLDESISSFGGIWANMDPSAYMVMLPAGLVSILIGVYWSVALLGATRKRALIVPTLAALVGGAIVIALNYDPGTYPWASDLAKNFYITRIVPVAMIYQLIFMGVGIFIGRPVARFIVRLALPPRSLVPLGVLWTRDGLAPPRPIAR